MAVHRYAILHVLLAFRGLDALLDQLFPLGRPQAVVLHPWERSRKVRKGCQAEGLTPLQERPKHPTGYRYNGFPCLPTATGSQSLQDPSTPRRVRPNSARLLPLRLLHRSEYRRSSQFCDAKLVWIWAQMLGALQTLPRKDTCFPYWVDCNREHPKSRKN